MTGERVHRLVKVIFGELLACGQTARLRQRGAGGTIVEWIVEDGDLVSPGQPLVRLHPESE